MTRDMAKHIAQHFMDARLIENAADKANTNFKDRAIFQITPKGLHVLERFIAKNGITADGLVTVFATQPICMKLLHLERRQSDDDIITTEHVILTVFRRFAGRAPNYIVNTAESPLDATQEYYERANGVPLQDIQERQQQMIGRGALQTYRNTFTALTALEWLCDFTTIVGRDEAAEMCAHFMRYRLIELVSDKRRTSDEAVIFTVRGPAGPNSLVVSFYGSTWLRRPLPSLLLFVLLLTRLIESLPSSGLVSSPSCSIIPLARFTGGELPLHTKSCLPDHRRGQAGGPMVPEHYQRSSNA